MERKQEEQTKQMKELQSHVERLQHENDQLQAHIGKIRDLGEDVQDSDRAVHSITRSKGKEPIAPTDIDTPIDYELSSSSSPSLSLSPAKNTRAKSHKMPSHRPAFSDTVSNASRRARRKASRG